jgi:hypothetical protein
VIIAENFMASRWIFHSALLAAVTIPALVSPVRAGPRDDVMQGSVRCLGIADDRAWLDCYYGAAQPMRAKLGLPPAPNAQQNLVPAAIPGAPEPLLLPQKPGFFGRMIDKISTPHEQKPEPPTHMTSYRFNSAGYFTVSLTNGETWRQSGSETILAHWRDKPASYSVTIQPGQLGLATMKVGNHETYQVERVNP